MEEIEKLREKLYKAIEKGKIKLILRISRNLDNQIVKFLYETLPEIKSSYCKL